MSQPAHRALVDRDELEAPYRSADPTIRRPPPSAAAQPLPADNLQSLLASFSPALPVNLNAPSFSSAPFPRLTLQQLAQLRDNGIDMDLCFVPHQMPRLTAHHLDEEGKEREKRCVTIDNCMAIAQLALVSTAATTTATSSTSTAPSSSTIPSPDSLSLSFTVNSRVPCRVSIYPAATEVIDRNVSDQPPVFTAHPQCQLWTQTLPAGLHQPVTVPLSSLFPVDVLNRAVIASSPSHPSPSSGGGSSSSFPSLFTFSSSRHYCPLLIHCENMSYQSSSSGLLPSSAQHKRRDEQKERVAIDIDTPPTVEHLIVYALFTKHQSSSAAVPPSQSPSSSAASSTAAASPAPSPTGRASTPSARSSSSAPAVAARAAAAAAAVPGPSVLGVKRLKQKIKLQHNRSYELFDLYGLREQPQSATAAVPQPAASQESADCVICLTNKRTHAIFPCRHVCLCADCAVMLREQTNRCPICRRMVETVIPILADGADDVVSASSTWRERYERH